MKYQIAGGNMPVVTCELEMNEAMISEAGGMAWMTPNMQMQTVSGGIGKAFGRIFSGESIFLNRYSAIGAPGSITFASSFPGSIIPLEIGYGKTMICQKSAFLSCTEGVTLSLHFNRRFSGGLFGGEGFILQRLEGQGMAFLEIDGSCFQYDLAPGQSMVIDTGYLAAMEASVTMNITSVSGIKNALFGGEGFFNTVLTGPGKIYLQSMPLPNFAGQIARFLPTK